MHDFSKTIPVQQPDAAHAACEYDDDEQGDSGARMLGSLLVYAVLVVASVDALVIVSRFGG